MRVIRDLLDIDRAWTTEYARLARAIKAVLPLKVGALVEVGCGSGQLTIPLARLVPEAQIDVIDRFEGPYSSDRSELLERLKSSGLVDRVRVLTGDATNFLRRLPSGSLDAVVSSEFLSELTTTGLSSFFTACRQALKEGGVTVHTFLSPDPQNDGQRLTIEADSDPRWTSHPPPQWFSPPRAVAQTALENADFGEVSVEIRRSRFRFTGPAARAQLRGWGVQDDFYRSREGALRAHGLELPDWIILGGTCRR